METRRFPARRAPALAAVLVALAALAGPVLAGVTGAAAGPPSAGPSRLAAVVRVASLLRLAPSSAPVPFVDMPAGSPDRRIVAAAWAAGLLDGLPGVGGRFDPSAPASRLFVTLLAADALPAMPGGAPPPAAAMAAAAEVPAMARPAVARMVALGLAAPPAAPAAWTAQVPATAWAGTLARLAALLAGDRPGRLTAQPVTPSPGPGVLDPIVVRLWGRSGPVPLLPGERLAVSLAPASGAAAQVGLRGGVAFLAARPGRWRLRLRLTGGLAPRAGIVAFVEVSTAGLPAALRLRTAAPSVVADGHDLVAVRVELVDAAGRTATGACAGGRVLVRLRAAGALRLEDPRTGAFNLGVVTVPCVGGAARFTVAAPVGALPGPAALVATTAGMGLAPAAGALVVTAPVAASVRAALQPPAVVQGGSTALRVEVLDQAGVPMPAGVFVVRVRTPRGLASPPGPFAYAAPRLPDGLVVPLAVSPGAPAGAAPVVVDVAGVGTVRAVLRVVAAGSVATRLVASLVAATVPVAAVDASTPADPADTVLVTAVNAAGAPVPYPGSLVVSVRRDGAPVAAGPGLAWRLVPAPPGSAGTAQLLLYGGGGATPAAGLYTFTIGAAPGSPTLAGVSVQIALVAPPA